MPRIPTYQQKRLPQPTPGVRVSPESMTKDIEAAAGFGQAVAGAGDLAMQFAQKMQEAREVTEFSNAKSAAKEGWNSHKLVLNELDYNLYEKETKKTKDKLYKEISSTITEKNAKATFDRWWQEYAIGQEFAINKLAQQKEIQSMAGDYYKNLNAAAERGDIEDINSLTLGAIKGNIIRADVGEKAKATALRRADAVLHKRIVDTAWFAAMSAPNRETAIEIIKGVEGLSGTERNSLISAYKREQNAKEAKIKKELEIAQTATQNDFINRVYDVENPLTETEVDTSNLNPVGGGSKAFFKELIEKRVKAVIENKNLPYTTTNAKTFADLLLQNTDPDKPPMTAAEILGYVPDIDGIGIPVAKGLIKTMDVRETDVFKNTEASLKAQFGYEGLLQGFGNKPLGALYYNNAMTELLADLAETPLKGVDLRNRMYEISSSYLEDFWRDTGESQDDIDKKLKLMGIKQSPALKLIPRE